jgi:ABC-type glycerol-3-phosphate transport system substrate-binding protein
MIRPEHSKPAWSVAAALLMTLVLAAACAAPSPSATKTPGPTATSATATNTPAATAAATPTPVESTAPEQLTLTVVSLRPGSEDAAFAAFDEQVAQFEAANPDINVESVEYEWTGPTFAAQLLGGTLPDVFTIPFTDGKSLIGQHQLADISANVAQLPYANKFNPNVLATGQDAAGNIFAVPTAAYGIGLHYNRALFTAAGLDPDQPPTTWAEVAEDAKAIADATGQAGYSQMSQSNTGGWQLTTLSYAHGGRLQEINGAEITSTIDNPGTRAALDFLRDLRWSKNAMGSNFLYDWGSINADFSAGLIGMYTSGSDVYNALISEQEISPDDYGLASLPLEGADPGLLGGGTLAAVNVNADDATKAAAVRWIDFYYMKKLLDQDAAVTDARTLNENDQPVGTPALPIFDQATYEQSREWISDFINVPVDQMTSFTENIFDQPLVPEPQAHSQEMYAILDSIVQAVLTDENADTDALLADADTQVQALIDAD